jgi:zinc protease
VLSFELHRHTLSNGLRVVLAPDPLTPVVAVNLWYGVGSRNEPPGRTGFAHLFEHMMFQGSKHVPKNRHFEWVEQAGGSLNASTWFDRTNYYETLPSHHLEGALWLEADRMGWLPQALDLEKLENQRGVVLNERMQRYENQPYGDWDERVQRLVFPESHPYHHTVIGSKEDITAATLEDVESFFRTYYVPDNAVLTLVGDLDPDWALERVERWFGEIPAGGPIPAIPGDPDPGPYIGETRRERVLADVPLPRIYLALRIPPYSSPDYPAADIATAVLADGRASRFYQRLVREQGLAKDAGAFSFPLLHGRSFMLAWATGFPGTDPDDLEAGLVREMEALLDVTEAEVARAVALEETRWLRQVESLASRADLLSMHELLFGDARGLYAELDRLRAVTPDAVRAFAESHLGAHNRAVVTYLPQADVPREGGE